MRSLLNDVKQAGSPVGAGGGHRDDGNTQGSRQDLGFDAQALLRGDIHHVESYDHRSGQGNQFGYQIKTAFEIRGIDNSHYNVGLLAQDEFPGDDLFG